MPKTYNRKNSTLIAVRFPSDVLALIRKRRKRDASFSAKLFDAIRKLNELENQNGGL